MLRSIWAARSSLGASLFRKPATPFATPGAYVQHVKIKNRRRIRNAAIGAGVLYACWSVYFTRVIAPPIAKHIDEDGQPLFIPFPFTFRIVESPPYKGTDPEWQEYIRIARDRELIMKIRTDMLDTVRRAAEKNPVLIHRCGRQMRLRRDWLDLDFPYRPPPKIKRNGLLLSDEGFDIVDMEVDPMTMMKVTRALWPVPVAQSAQSFVSTLFWQNVQNVARYFGYADAIDTHPPPNPLAIALKKRLEEAERRAAAQNGGEGGSSSSNKNGGIITTSEASTTGTLNTGKVAAETTTLSTSTSTSSDSRDNDTVNARDLIPFESVRASIDDAWLEFKKKLAQTWRPIRPQPPSGCVGVSGFVELETANSRIMIEVEAFWNPKTRKYDTNTIHMKLRAIRARNQAPLWNNRKSGEK